MAPEIGRRGDNGGGGEAPGRRNLLLDVLRDSATPRSIVSLAQELGVHANTVRFHLEALLRAGQVEQVLGEADGPGRPPVLFRATRRMNPAGATNYQFLATMLTSHLVASSPDPLAAATELGRSWGPHVVDIGPLRQKPRVTRREAVAQLNNVLTDLGFSPEPPTGPRDATIRLRHCPFLSLVTDTEADSAGSGNGEVICAMHLGLMQGALSAMHSPVTADRLQPFVEPDLCVAHLVPVAAAHAERDSADG